MLTYVLCNAGWSSPVARQAHNLKVLGSNPSPATNFNFVRSSPDLSLSKRRRTVVTQQFGFWRRSADLQSA